MALLGTEKMKTGIKGGHKHQKKKKKRYLRKRKFGIQKKMIQ